MFGKKKKGDLGDIVFPEFPNSKDKDKLPPLEIPKFNNPANSKDSKDIKQDAKPAKLELPELKIPQFPSNKQPEQPKKQLPEFKAPVIEKKHDGNKFAPPHESRKPELKIPEIRKPVAVEVRKQIMPEVKKPVMQPKPITAPRPMFPSKPVAAPKPVHIQVNHKQVLPKQQMAAKIPSLAAKPEVEQQHHKFAPAHEAKKIEKPKHEIKKMPKHEAKKHVIKLKPLKLKHPKIKIKVHHLPKIPKIKQASLKKHMAKPIFRALRHVTVKGPVKPKDKLSLKRLGHHMSDIEQDISKYHKLAVSQDSFSTLRKSVEKEVDSIRKIYREFDVIQRDFKKAKVDFENSKKELDHQVKRAKALLNMNFQTGEKSMKDTVESSRRFVHNHLEKFKSSINSNVMSAKKDMESDLNSAKSSMAKQLEATKKLLHHNQDELIAKINKKLDVLSSANDTLTKDLGKLAFVESKLDEKIDVSTYNQVVKKINEIEGNAAANESHLDNELSATIAYLKKLAERVLQHEAIMQDIYAKLNKKDKYDISSVMEEYENMQQPEESYPDESMPEEEQF